MGSPLIHLTYYKNKVKHKQQFTAIDKLISERRPIIVDRYILSDKVYGSVYRNGKVIDSYDVLYNNLVNNPDVIIIFALSLDKDKYLDEFKKLCSEREEMYTDNMDKVYDEYLEMYAGLLGNTDIKCGIVRYDRFAEEGKFIESVKYTTNYFNNIFKN